uniref:FBD domain-containing protein n=1 Tax=Macrostomum lignano TaxID=282301 RepID=A0A1I8FKY9_9PLAT
LESECADVAFDFVQVVFRDALLLIGSLPAGCQDDKGLMQAVRIFSSGQCWEFLEYLGTTEAGTASQRYERTCLCCCNSFLLSFFLSTDLFFSIIKWLLTRRPRLVLRLISYENLANLRISGASCDSMRSPCDPSFDVTAIWRRRPDIRVTSPSKQTRSESYFPDEACQDCQS